MEKALEEFSQQDGSLLLPAAPRAAKLGMFLSGKGLLELYKAQLKAALLLLNPEIIDEKGKSSWDEPGKMLRARILCIHANAEH